MKNLTCQELEREEPLDCFLQGCLGLSVYHDLALIKLGEIVVIVSSNNSSIFLSLVKLCLTFQVKILFHTPLVAILHSSHFHVFILNFL